MHCSLIDYRIYGQPKIHKPKFLRGLKPVLKVKCMRKPVDIYEMPGYSVLIVYFGNLFSRLMTFPNVEDMGLPYCALKAKYPERLANAKSAVKGFVYADAWCPIYERNEGWVRIEGLTETLRNPFDVYLPKVQYDLFEEFRKLSLLDKGFCDIANYDDMCVAEYRRTLDDIVQWLYKRIRG